MTMSSAATDRPFVAVHFGDHPAADNFCHRWEAGLLARGIGVKRVDLLGPAGLAQLEDCIAVMWHWYHNAREKRAAPAILPAIEQVLGLPVFPNHATRWHFDEKLAQHYLFAAAGVRRVPTWVFWQHDKALDFLESATYPLVFKLSAGAGSSGVRLVHTPGQARELTERIFREGLVVDELPAGEAVGSGLLRLRRLVDRAVWALRYLLRGRRPPANPSLPLQLGYVYFQDFLPGNDHDIRITVIGGRAFGYIRQNRTEDFRASGSGNFNVDPDKIPLEAIEMAHALSDRLGFQSMAYDFLRDRDGSLCLNEISYGYVNWMVQRCPGHWDRQLCWHPGSIWPEDAQVDDFLAELDEAARS